MNKRYTEVGRILLIFGLKLESYGKGLFNFNIRLQQIDADGHRDLH